jgi:ATP-binding cassette subfamily B multidrug efflux pump
MKSLSTLNKYFIKYKWRLILGTLFVVISNAFAIFPAEVFRKGIDEVAAALEKQKLTGEFNDALYTTLFQYGLIILGSALLKGLFLFFMRQTIIVMSRLIEFDMKNEIYSHYQQLDLAFYKRNKTGDLMARISEDVSQVRMYLGPAIMYSISTVTLFVMILTQMILIHPMLTLYVVLPLPILAVTVYLINSKVIALSDSVQKQLSTISSYVQEFFSGIRVVRGYNRTDAEILRFEDEAEQYKNRNLDLVRINALFAPVMVFLIGLSTIITIYVGGLKVYSGEITTGVIAEFVIYVTMLTWPVASIGWVTAIMQRAAASQTRIVEFLDVQSSFKTPNNAKQINEIGDIRFENISFVYSDSGTKALNEVSFEIKKGQSLGIIGKTGSGKTTIAQLLMRLYDPNQGQILIDKHSLPSIDINAFRQQVAYVPQEVFLFSDTIFNNIAFGIQKDFNGDLKQAVEHAAQMADIHDSILGFPQGYETMLGERGINLSGGQKQRISIARAMIRKPSVLILDDCLSAVDTVTEERILSNLEQVLNHQTTIIISHRISSVLLCEQIIALELGEIIEKGKHSQLMEKNGYYASIFQQQNFEKKYTV